MVSYSGAPSVHRLVWSAPMSWIISDHHRACGRSHPVRFNGQKLAFAVNGWVPGTASDVVGNWRGAISGHLKVSLQLAEDLAILNREIAVSTLDDAAIRLCLPSPAASTRDRRVIRSPRPT